MDEYLARRQAIARRYDALLADLPLKLPRRHPEDFSALHLYIVRLQPDATGRSHREVFEALRDAGIGVNLHYIPVHLQPYYRAMGFDEGDFPEAERYYAEAITLPIYPGLEESQQDRVVDALREALQA